MHKELKGWVTFLGIEEPISLSKIHGDDKSKRYYRINNITKKLIVLDASDEKEMVPRFIGIGMRLKKTKISTPLVRSFELHKGFMLLDDMGSTHLFDKCSRKTYEKAIRTLVEMQKAPTVDLEQSDMNVLIEEMNLMLEWYYKAHLAKTLECVEGQQLIKTFMTISQEVLAQPQETFVHRDYHAKNLMIDEADEIVVLDFQDAKKGAVTYDLASLLYDPYVALDKRERRRFIKLFQSLKGIEVDDETFMRWFDFTAVQRNLMLLGLFSKYSMQNSSGTEDAKRAYLEHIPLIRQYVLDIASNYPELETLVRLLTPEEEDSEGFSF